MRAMSIDGWIEVADTKDKQLRKERLPLLTKKNMQTHTAYDEVDAGLALWAEWMRAAGANQLGFTMLDSYSRQDLYERHDSERAEEINAAINSLTRSAQEAIELRYGLRKHTRVSTGNPAWSTMSDGDKALYHKVWRVRSDGASGNDKNAIKIHPTMDFDEAKKVLTQLLKKRGVIN